VAAEITVQQAGGARFSGRKLFTIARALPKHTTTFWRANAVTR